MQFFQWDQSFETGSALVDEQHQELIRIVNRFGEHLAENSSGAETIQQACTALTRYANYHFEEEERLMKAVGIDQRHLLPHLQQHVDLLLEIDPLRQLIAVGNLAASRYMFEFLINWLVFHILGTDMLMAGQIHAIKQGQSAAAAYLAEEKNTQSSNAVLLAAVKRLLYKISSRNRELAEWNETLEQKVRERTSELSRANQKLQELATTDSLTGLLNRRAFMDEARLMFDVAQRYQRPLSFLMIDADRFKQVNDNYGHQAGDLVLVKLATLIEESLRGTDIVGRIGGEEFAVILPETSLEQTVELTERLLERIRKTVIDLGTGQSLQITISIGVATIPPVARDIEAVMKTADEQLYRAKEDGRDRCCGLEAV